MRRQLRRELPWLSALYGLRWADIESMPFDELKSYQDQYNDVRQAFRRVEIVRFDD